MDHATEKLFTVKPVLEKARCAIDGFAGSASTTLVVIAWLLVSTACGQTALQDSDGTPLPRLEQVEDHPGQVQTETSEVCTVDEAELVAHITASASPVRVWIDGKNQRTAEDFPAADHIYIDYATLERLEGRPLNEYVKSLAAMTVDEYPLAWTPENIASDKVIANVHSAYDLAGEIGEDRALDYLVAWTVRSPKEKSRCELTVHFIVLSDCHRE